MGGLLSLYIFFDSHFLGGHCSIIIHAVLTHIVVTIIIHLSPVVAFSFIIIHSSPVAHSSVFLPRSLCVSFSQPGLSLVIKHLSFVMGGYRGIFFFPVSCYISNTRESGCFSFVLGRGGGILGSLTTTVTLFKPSCEYPPLVEVGFFLGKRKGHPAAGEFFDTYWFLF